MKSLLSSLLLFVLSHGMNAEDVILRGKEYPEQKKGEGIMVMVREDRSLLSDSGPTTITKLLQTCKEWRSQGTEPGIVIVLYPVLFSNLDFGSILDLLRKLDVDEVTYSVLIGTKEEDPPKELLTGDKTQNKAAQATASPSPSL